MKEKGEVTDADFSFLNLIVSKIEERIKGVPKKIANQSMEESKDSIVMGE
jgi:hypothetical protein